MSAVPSRCTFAESVIFVSCAVSRIKILLALVAAGSDSIVCSPPAAGLESLAFVCSHFLEDFWSSGQCIVFQPSLSLFRLDDQRPQAAFLRCGNDCRAASSHQECIFRFAALTTRERCGTAMRCQPFGWVGSLHFTAQQLGSSHSSLAEDARRWKT